MIVVILAVMMVIHVVVLFDVNSDDNYDDNDHCDDDTGHGNVLHCYCDDSDKWLIVVTMVSWKRRTLVTMSGFYGTP